MNKPISLYKHQLEIIEFLKEGGKKNITSEFLGLGVHEAVKQFLHNKDALIIDNVGLKNTWSGVGNFVSFQSAILHGIREHPIDKIVFVGEPPWTNKEGISVKKLNEILKPFINVITCRHSFCSLFEFQEGSNIVVRYNHRLGNIGVNYE